MSKKMKGSLRTVVVVAAMAIAFLIYAMMAWQDAGLPPAEEVIGDTLAQDKADGAESTRAIDWDALPPEVVAWVEVPGTRIDEPIVQASEDAPNAYLRIDVLGRGACGTPYIDSECSLDSYFIMVYGHHMSDGSVFADFAKLSDEVFAREHRRVMVHERADSVRELEVVAVDVVDANAEQLVIPTFSGFEETLHSCDIVLSDCQPERLWAFATCSYGSPNERTVVYAADAWAGSESRT